MGPLMPALPGPCFTGAGRRRRAAVSGAGSGGAVEGWGPLTQGLGPGEAALPQAPRPTPQGAVWEEALCTPLARLHTDPPLCHTDVRCQTAGHGEGLEC